MTHPEGFARGRRVSRGRRGRALRGALVVGIAGIGLSGGAAWTAVAAEATQASAAAASQRAVVEQYCVTCHNERMRAGQLSLDALAMADVGEDAEVWERVIQKLRGGMMPPPGAPRPDPATYDGLRSWLETSLDRAAAAHPNPGRTESLHRLNRAEYQNAVRDFLDFEIDVTELLPADDASYGFDNMAGVLKLNQSVLERYLSAAAKVTRAAIGDRSVEGLSKTYIVSRELSQYERVEGLPFGTRGGTLIQHYFPQDGIYELKVELLCTTDVDLKCDAAGGFTQAFELEILIDGERVHLSDAHDQQVFTIEAREAQMGYLREWDEAFKVRVPVPAGPHEVGVTFVKGASVEYVRHGLRKRFERPYRYYSDQMHVAEPFVDSVRIVGPYESTGLGDTPSRRRIFTCRPASDAAEDTTACARTILAPLARQAYRRPVTEAEVEELLTFFRDGQAEAGFEAGIDLALRRVLTSPSFLFRTERDPAAGTDAPYAISDLELASRLSFFLWSSVPDEELIGLASRNALRDPAVLEQQVRRMLTDGRAHALVDNFFGQWLKLRHIDALQPSELLFPDFDTLLKESLKRETELFVEFIIQEDRSVLDLLNADYTFVNGRLARHYEIPHVQGTEFRRVTYPDDRRRGLLGHGSILTLTSHAIRTSPVLRGKWVLDTILGSPPPAPPANVPPFEEADLASKTVVSMKERMAAHRSNPVCAACHSMIDPAGFALENFNPVGQWRDVDETFSPLDTSGALPDGTQFTTLTNFREALWTHPERFVHNMTEKLLTYALGRGVEYYDQPAIRRIVREAAETDYRFSALLMGVVSSLPFQMRQPAESSQVAAR